MGSTCKSSKDTTFKAIDFIINNPEDIDSITTVIKISDLLKRSLKLHKNYLIKHFEQFEKSYKINEIQKGFNAKKINILIFI